MGIILAFRYRLFARYAVPKAIVAIGVFGALQFLSGTIDSDNNLMGTISVLFFYAVYLSLLWIVFRSEIRNRLAVQRKLMDDIEANRHLVEQGKLISGVAHNMAQPIGSAQAAITLLKQDSDQLDDDMRRALERANNATRKLGEMLNNMREYTRLQTKTYGPFSVRQICKSLVEQEKFRPEFKRTVQIDVRGEVELVGDGVEVFQVIQNLVRNSAEAIQSRIQAGETQRGHIDIELGREGNDALIVVKDNGGGFGTEGEIPISSFERGKTTKEYGSGEGVLYVVQTVRRWNGGIFIHSTSTGTIVSIRIPLSEHALAQDAAGGRRDQEPAATASATTSGV
jgi:signal transduction histidine kinase